MVFEQCKKTGVTLSSPKAQVGTQVKFDGFLVGQNRIVVDPAKVEA